MCCLKSYKGMMNELYSLIYKIVSFDKLRKRQSLLDIRCFETPIIFYTFHIDFSTIFLDIKLSFFKG